MYVTSRGAPRTGLPFVLPVSFDKIVNNQVLRKIKIAVKSDVKNWAYISLR